MEAIVDGPLDRRARGQPQYDQRIGKPAGYGEGRVIQMPMITDNDPDSCEKIVEQASGDKR